MFLKETPKCHSKCQSGSDIQPFKIRKHSKSRIFGDQISNGLVFNGSNLSYMHSLKTGPFKIWTIVSIFQMAVDKMVAAICLNFKWLGFQISDPIQNLDQLQTNLFSTIWNLNYTWGSKSELGKPNTVLIPNISLFWFRAITFVLFSKSRDRTKNLRLALIVLYTNKKICYV